MAAEQDVIFEVSETLTREEDNFALAYIECRGNVGMAYKLVFGADAPNPTALGRQLLSRPAVVDRIRQLTAHDEQLDLCSKEDHLHALAHIRDVALATGMPKVALEAEVSRGKVAGHYAPEVVVPPPQIPPSESLRQLAGNLTGLLRSAKQSMENQNVEDATLRSQAS